MTMKEEHETILALVKKNMRTSIGRISMKELRVNGLVTDILDAFEVVSKSNPSSSAMAIRAKIQELLSNNTVPYSGRCRYPTLCTEEFLRDMTTSFTLTRKPKKNVKSQSLRAILSMLAMVFILGGCGNPEPDQDAIKRDLRESILAMSRENYKLKVNIPIQQRASDTLLMLLNKTQDQYTRNILIQNVQELNAAIEKNKILFSDNAYKIDRAQREYTWLENGGKEPVELAADSSYVIGGDTVSSSTLIPSVRSDTL